MWRNRVNYSKISTLPDKYTLLHNIYRFFSVIPSTFIRRLIVDICHVILPSDRVIINSKILTRWLSMWVAIIRDKLHLTFECLLVVDVPLRLSLKNFIILLPSIFHLSRILNESTKCNVLSRSTGIGNGYPQ